MKNILILGALIIVVLGLIVLLGKPKEMSAPTTATTEDPMTEETDTIDNGAVITTNSTTTVTSVTTTPGKLKADTFTGTLTKVDTRCFSDGECFVEVDGKKVTTLFGFNQAEVGSVIGVEGFGDLENYIGKAVEVYAQDNSDGTYTLYGSAGFYIKVLE
ncbi:hypothetical protein K2P47_01540 [Patescibacteria group bacterium]|nr:hypothetical protein [Patescibacteria group bacterium]